MRTINLYEYSELDKVSKYKAFTDYILNPKANSNVETQAQFQAMAHADAMEFTVTGRRF
jgi:hypothetical protein